MALFDNIFDVAQKSINDAFGITVIIDGKEVVGMFSTPSVNAYSDKASFSTILQKKIFDFNEKENGLIAKEGQKVVINNQKYFIDEIYRDSYGHARVTLQEDYE